MLIKLVTAICWPWNGISNVCPKLIRQIQIWQDRPGMQTKWWNVRVNVNKIYYLIWSVRIHYSDSTNACALNSDQSGFRNSSKRDRDREERRIARRCHHTLSKDGFRRDTREWKREARHVASQTSILSSHLETCFLSAIINPSHQHMLEVAKITKKLGQDYKIILRCS